MSSGNSARGMSLTGLLTSCLLRLLAAVALRRRPARRAPGLAAVRSDPIGDPRARDLVGLTSRPQPDVTGLQAYLAGIPGSDQLDQRLGGPRWNDLVAPAEDVQKRD